MESIQVIKVFGEDVPALDNRVESYGVLTQHAVKIARYCYHKRHMLILRAPTASSVKYRAQNPCGWSDDVAAKPVFIKEKTKGELTSHGFYSDYDILSYWKSNGNGYEKLDTGSVAPHKTVGELNPQNVQAETNKYLESVPDVLFELMASTGISDFQHGANDDYVDVNGKPMRQLVNEKFVIFDQEALIHLVPDTGAMKRFYAERNLAWIYK